MNGDFFFILEQQHEKMQLKWMLLLKMDAALCILETCFTFIFWNSQKD